MSDVAFVAIMVTALKVGAVLAVLFLGEPDLMDAIIARIMP